MDNVFSFENKAEARKVILKSILNETIEKDFLINNRGEDVTIYFDEKTARTINDVTPFGFFESEEKARALLIGALYLNLDQIVDYVTSNTAKLTIQICTDEPLGYKFDENNDTIETRTANLILRKDRGNATSFGFFVSNFYPT